MLTQNTSMPLAILAHIPPWVVIPGFVFVLPLALMWAIWTLSYGTRIAGFLVVRVALLFVIILVSIQIFSTLAPSSVKGIVYAVFMPTCIVYFWGHILLHWVRRGERGRVLLSIGVTAERIVILVAGAVVLVTAGMELFQAVRLAISPGSQTVLALQDMLKQLLMVTLGCYASLASIFGQRITEQGLYCWWCLTCWEKIKSYNWGGRGGSTLILELRKRVGFWNRLYIVIPLRQRDMVVELLAEKLLSPDSNTPLNKVQPPADQTVG